MKVFIYRYRGRVVATLRSSNGQYLASFTDDGDLSRCSISKIITHIIDFFSVQTDFELYYEERYQ